MARNTTLKYTIRINAPQQDVFNYIMDWEKQSKWIMLTKVHKTSKDSNQIGTTLSARTGVGPLGFVDTMIIEKWDAPNSCVVVHTGKIVRGKGIFAVNKIDDNNSEFVWDEITPVPFGLVGSLGLYVVKPILRILFNHSLKKLKKNIEKINS